jgi:glycosidase
MLLILDYVPNHLAPDHEWVTTHPEYFIQGSPEDLRADPPAYRQVGEQIFTTGRNQEVYPWTDVLQLNIFSSGLRQATKELVTSLAAQCDGLRCDAAMLMLNQVFLYTWQGRAGKPPKTEFWSDIIHAARATSPDFLFVAETYWHTERQLLDLGFDYCFDKNDFYDALVDDKTADLFHLLFQQPEHQRRMIRGLENHDERRAATAFSLDKQKAAAVLIATSPGSHMYYEGQFDGVQKQTPVAVRREPPHKPEVQIGAFYNRLLPLAHSITYDFIDWHMCNVITGKGQHISSVLAWTWQDTKATHYLVLINWNKRKRHVVVRVPWQTSNFSTSDITCPFSTKGFMDMQLTDHGLDCSLDPYQAVILEVKPET